MANVPHGKKEGKRIYTSLDIRKIFLMLSVMCSGCKLRYCPECGGELKYTSVTKRYVCISCGLSITHQELMELRAKLRPSFESEEDKRRKERKEYLKWWLGKKK